MARNSKDTACPCGGGPYTQCCGRFIGTAQPAHTAEQLMRSRYTAYVLRDEAYLQATWYPRCRPEPPIVRQDETLKWIGLDIMKQAENGDDATVEFIARYKIGGRAQRLHEVSRFVREEGCWFYLDGSFPDQ